MCRRALTAALISAFVLPFAATLHARAASLKTALVPRFCFGSLPVACPVFKSPKAVRVTPLTTTIEQANPVVRYRSKWRFRLSADYDLVQTNTLGGQGSGDAVDAALKIRFPGGRFSDTFRFSRYNIEVPVVRFCPTCGAPFLTTDNENDDYVEYGDDLDYWCPDDDEWGFGISYNYFHPIYAIEAVDMSGFGFGIDRAPKGRTDYSLYGSLYYYPNISGSSNFQNTRLAYQIWKYDAGVNYRPVLSNPLSFQLGLKGESWIGKGQASNVRVIGGYLGSSYSW